MFIYTLTIFVVHGIARLSRGGCHESVTQFLVKWWTKYENKSSSPCISNVHNRLTQKQSCRTRVSVVHCLKKHLIFYDI